MKPLVILLVGVAFVFFRCSDTVKHSDSPIYSELKKEEFGPFDKEKKLNIIVGIDYLPYEFVEMFEELTGIKVIVDIFDSNEILEAKLLAGGSQYDVVFPTAWPHFTRQLAAKIYQPIDKTKVDFSRFNPVILEKLAKYEHGNDFCVPYQFGISGIGMDVSIVDKVLPGADKSDLSIFLDPKNAEKLSKVRFCLYDSSGELFPIIFAYLGRNPEEATEEDVVKAAECLKRIRPYVYKFTPFGFEDLSSQNAALVLGSSGDILKVSKDNNRESIKFFCPKQGTDMWLDVAAIPVGAEHLNNVYAFFKFLLHPRVIAEITNRTYRANCVTEATQYVKSEIAKNKDIYPSAEFCKKCYIEKAMPSKLETMQTRLLTKIKSMR